MKLLGECPVYAPTPLQNETALAADIGIAEFFVKNEAQRMRLGSFKALGGAFAVAQMLADASGASDLMGEDAKSVAASMTFITASAGNHGLSVAAGANVFGAKAVIVLSAAVPEGFAERIRGLGADVVRIDGSYEDSVAYAIAAAEENDWLLLADGSWEGYTERPALVMEGYTVLADECRQAFDSMRNWPTHVLLQAGVGGFAAAVAAHIRDHWPMQPNIIIVEPDAAPCLINSFQAGRLTRGEGPESNMGRLDCKDASLIAFDGLRQDADTFMTVSDIEASEAVEMLGRHGYATTESGAAPVAGLKKLGLPPESRVMVVVTEGLEGGE